MRFVPVTWPPIISAPGDLAYVPRSAYTLSSHICSISHHCLPVLIPHCLPRAPPLKGHVRNDRVTSNAAYPEANSSSPGNRFSAAQGDAEVSLDPAFSLTPPAHQFASHTRTSLQPCVLSSSSFWVRNRDKFVCGFSFVWRFSRPPFCLILLLPLILSLSLNTCKPLSHYNQKNLSGADAPRLRIFRKLLITF